MNQVYIKGHFNNFSVVVLFNFLQELVIGGGNEVNSNTLSTESTTSSDSVDILFLGKRKIVVNNKRDLFFKSYFHFVNWNITC